MRQRSYELPSISHGEFMYHVIQGVSQRSAVTHSDGILTGQDLFSYIYSQMKEDPNSAKPYEDRQTPRIDYHGPTTLVLGKLDLDSRFRGKDARFGTDRAAFLRYLKENDGNLRNFDLTGTKLNGLMIPEGLDLSGR